jgi:uncharacterized membrane protein HdeD (DUF308 family)
MTLPHAERVKPTDRRWVLVGMAVGAGIGLLVATIPEPAGPFLLWACFGALIGFAFPSMTLLVLILLLGQNQKAWWWMSGIGGAVGLVVGIVLGARGDPPPEGAVALAVTCGFLGGYAVAEFYLRRIDAQKRQQIDRDQDAPFS